MSMAFALRQELVQFQSDRRSLDTWANWVDLKVDGGVELECELREIALTRQSIQILPAARGRIAKLRVLKK